MGAETSSQIDIHPDEITGPRSNMSARCPHCRSAARVRSSVEIAITYRVRRYECTNIFCGHVWNASESYEYGLRPSAVPDPAVDLPLKQPTRQEMMDMLRPVDPDQPDMFAPARHPQPVEEPVPKPPG